MAETYSFEEVADFVRQRSGWRREISASTSLQNDMKLYGDDIHELMKDYAKRYNVDKSNYLWYFHTGEEGIGIGSLFFKPPYRRVKEIPITLALLHESANRGRWALEYPEHTLPKYRIDIFINIIFAVLLLAGVIAIVILKFL
jgi:hypothetical protein